MSYSSKNKNVADAIVADFEQHGIRCWYAPRDIMPGSSWVSAITDALRMVKVQVLIYTDESNNSRQVMNEVALAFNEGKTIVPFRLSATKMSDEFEYYLSRVHWLDAVTKSLADNITQLREYVGVILSGVDKAYASDVSKPKKPLCKIVGICAAALVIVLALLTVYLISSDRGDDTSVEVRDTAEETVGAAEKSGASASENPGVAGERTTAGAAEKSGASASENPGAAGEGTTAGAAEKSGAFEKENAGEGTTVGAAEKSGGLIAEKPGAAGEGTTAEKSGASEKENAGATEEKDVYDMSVEELEIAARKGDPVACELLGSMYYSGGEVDQNYGKARQYLEKSEQNGSRSAKVYKMLGDIYYYGKDVDASDSEAGKYYKMAIDMGVANTEVLANYGMILYRDDDFEESARYFAMAAESGGDPTDMYNAGLAYYNANDTENAVKWLEKAIDSGFSRPQDAKRMIDSVK